MNAVILNHAEKPRYTMTRIHTRQNMQIHKNLNPQGEKRIFPPRTCSPRAAGHPIPPPPEGEEDALWRYTLLLAAAMLLLALLLAALQVGSGGSGRKHPASTDTPDSREHFQKKRPPQRETTFAAMTGLSRIENA